VPFQGTNASSNLAGDTVGRTPGSEGPSANARMALNVDVAGPLRVMKQEDHCFVNVQSCFLGLAVVPPVSNQMNSVAVAV
jgi:hypothetical protein